MTFEFFPEFDSVSIHQAPGLAGYHVFFSKSQDASASEIWHGETIVGEFCEVPFSVVFDLRQLLYDNGWMDSLWIPREGFAVYSFSPSN